MQNSLRGQQSSREPVRILHVIGGLGRGGTETWLIDLLRNSDRSQYAMDIMIQSRDGAALEDEAKALGAKVILCPRDILWPLRFLSVLLLRPRYDIVHSHRNNFSAFVLLLSAMAGIRVRIAHSHNDLRLNEATSDWGGRLYYPITRWLIARMSTGKIGVSRAAQASLFAVAESSVGGTDSEVIYCGIDLQRHSFSLENRLDVRAEFDISHDSVLVGHVGGFRSQKNHRFLIDLFRLYMDLEPRARLLLVGDGELRAELEEYVFSMGMQESVIFAGVRDDVSKLLSAMDVFVFPSIHEGLPIILMECQASGLPVLVSSGVSGEIEYTEGLFRWLGLEHGVTVWSTTLNEMPKRLELSDTYSFASGSANRFDIQESTRSVIAFYIQQLQNISSFAP